MKQGRFSPGGDEFGNTGADGVYRVRGHVTANLYPALDPIPWVYLVAACDLKEDLARRNTRRLGARAWYTDMDKMLTESGAEGVLAVGDPQMHVTVGPEVLKRGLPLFVEKPSAIDTEEARKLAQAAEKPEPSAWWPL
ncbi:MAG: Gfo/Idh/MocA family oxidoreductase [Armatimonadetes bacterium]|nr:Gfo/Idh/MocA family oxidoreductase [Armatimonadota bacterium]